MCGGGDGGGGKHSLIWLSEPAPKTGFSGGRPPRYPLCANPDLPGCQTCLTDWGCTACWAELGDAAFVLNPDTRRCMCPPGYGLRSDDLGDLVFADDDLPQRWGWSRHLLGETLPASAALHKGGAGVPSSFGLPHNGSGHGLPWDGPTPPWAIACMPCPEDWYSPGGDIGFATCKPCPQGWSTGDAGAASNCLVPFCGPGQQPNPLEPAQCKPCPYGTWSSSNANNRACIACKGNWTTAVTGATSVDSCRVQLCRPGQQLDLDLFVCTNCTGNTFSPGGVPGNGPFQPTCQPCPEGTAASSNRSQCLENICPPPDAFRIECDTSLMPECGPGDKPILLSRFCKAFPPGAQITWRRAVVLLVNSTSGVSVVSLAGNGPVVDPPIAYCPAGAYGSNYYLPVISSFNGLDDCICTNTTSCAFATGVAPAGSIGLFGTNINETIYVKVPDPQLDSLQTLVSSMAPNNFTSYPNLVGGYCQQSSAAAQSGLRVLCRSNLITNVTLLDTNLNGTLPPAAQLPGLSQLQWLRCRNCQLRGLLPEDWGWSGNLMNLRYLRLDGNQSFEGVLPSTWGNMVNLIQLGLDSKANASTPTIPLTWGGMRSLSFVNMTGWWFAGCSAQNISNVVNTEVPICPNSTACAPRRWLTDNGLVLGGTLNLPPPLGFCPFDQLATAPGGRI